MENKTFTYIQNHSSNSDSIKTTPSNSFLLPPTIHTTTTTPSLQTLQAVPQTHSIEVNSDNNNTNRQSNTISTFNIKEEHFDNTSIEEAKSIGKNKLKLNNTFQPTVITPLHIRSRDTIHNLPSISMSTTNMSGHLMSNLNPSHLSDGIGPYFVSGLQNDITSNYKLPRSLNSDLPSPSTSSNSSSANHHHQAKRHEEGGDPTRKRTVRLQKNRDAARECRRKKKEYIKCLEERVTGLENQNKALIEELRQLKELYCQREETNHSATNKTPTSTR